MTSVQKLEKELKEARAKEKRLKLLSELESVIKKMNRLNSAMDLEQILENKPLFADEFYLELVAVQRKLKGE